MTTSLQGSRAITAVTVVKKSRNLERHGGWKIFRYLTLATFVVIASVLILGTLVGGKFGLPQRMTLQLIGTLQKSISLPINVAKNLGHDYVALVGLRAKNDQLKNRIDELEQDLQEYREGYHSYQYLEDLLAFKKQQKFELLSAKVVGKGSGGWYQTMVVDLGRNDDVIPGMLVLAPQGVVGQIIQVSDNYAKVLLANAPSSAIDAIVQKNRVRGILKGNGQKGFTLEYVLKNSDVAVGDDIVTAGVGGIFPTGMYLGTVTEVHDKRRGMFLEIEVTPGVKFENLEYVLIDPSDRRDIREFIDSRDER